MKRAVIIFALAMTSCGPITKEELDMKFSKVESRLSKIEESQKKLEEQNIKTEMRVDNLAETLTKLRLDVEKLKIPERGENYQKTEKPQTPERIEKETKSVENYQREYEEAVKLYNMGQLTQAKDKLIGFIKKNPQTNLTDNAYFWLGVTFRDLNELDKAEVVWLTLVEKCKKMELPDCNKAPAAYLQLARLYEQKGNQQKANEIYQSLIEEYPLSEEAEIAKRKVNK
ncbi:MAG: tetratricopeptide repeat protein [Aquificaceae bacterium]